MMHQSPFPEYTPRKIEEKIIKKSILNVQNTGESRIVIIYGEGGVGKSYLLRNLPQRLQLERVLFLAPIDIDDAEFWSVTNLNRHIAEHLPQDNYFQPYKLALTKMPDIEKEKVGHETVLGHLRKTNRIFVDDYHDFVQKSGLTPVITLDTIEAIRGTDTLNRLLLWLKKLSGTLIILAGRPVEEDDPIIGELNEQPKLEYVNFTLGRFSREESLQYLQDSPIEKRLIEEEKQRLALLSKGHPLWLALSIYYLNTIGIPEEIEKLDIKAGEVEWPYQNGALHDAYLRRLVIPYRESNFWHEAIFRLGIVRRRVSQELWRDMMSDRSLPSDISSWDEAWQKLLDFPWIRPRANKKYVTLQDALAEELAHRIIPYRDFDGEKRLDMWGRASSNYRKQIFEKEAALEKLEMSLDKTLATVSSTEMQDSLLEQIFNFDKRKFELYLLQTTHLYYQMLCDYKIGTNKFIQLLDEKTKQHLIRFVELLWDEMQRFLPGEETFDPLDDVVKPAVKKFQDWYQNRPEIQYEIITRVAKYLYEIGQPDQAERFLNSLWEVCQGNPEWEYQILKLRGNARVRSPGRARDAQKDFEDALSRTRTSKASEKLRRLEGEALSELGYYHRNMGNWGMAGDQYLEAQRCLTPMGVTQELAAVQSQYAYVQALMGIYESAHSSVDAALSIRALEKEEKQDKIGMALSVKGEIYRYERQFYNAWVIYQDAEEIFAQFNNWGWLGLIRQEMAICLFQAFQAGELLPDYDDFDEMLSDAREMSENALDFCREYSRRSYPSALNRAGRIVGAGYKDYEKSLEYLEEGIKQAKALADGWFWFANLVEYSETCYKARENLGDSKYLRLIQEKETEIEQVYKDYPFLDLRGRWEILQGQINVDNSFQNENESIKRNLLSEALERFAEGYPLIAYGYVGSHGARALPSEIEKLAKVLEQLDRSECKRWLDFLNKRWSASTKSVSKDRQVSALLSSWTQLSVRFQEFQGEQCD